MQNDILFLLLDIYVQSVANQVHPTRTSHHASANGFRNPFSNSPVIIFWIGGTFKILAMLFHCSHAKQYAGGNLIFEPVWNH